MRGKSSYEDQRYSGEVKGKRSSDDVMLPGEHRRGQYQQSPSKAHTHPDVAHWVLHDA